ncbi:protein IMPACT-like isoform X1 [Schistocerca americana]|uniref:protein IMPACT-like isoform X1 n=2 Tax=Schistocerca americana TaxID=7009 RepID=UPI001F4F1627|nr:protein IMPACT-like isoform X1 [Schistocerca americana]
MEDNVTKQADEIEALASIYGDDWKVEDEVNRSYSISLKECGQEITLYFILPPEYPSTAPPKYQLSAPGLKPEEKNLIISALDELSILQCGQTVIYEWVEKVRELVQDFLPLDKGTEDFGIDSAAFSSVTCEQQEYEFELPQIIHGETITDRKSVFQGHAAPVFYAEQVKAILQKLYENKKIANATHNMYAYRIFKDDTKSFLQDCEDDGETHAGGRLLHLLQILDMKNVLVVVTRWYGGILLGPDRFRHINNAARQVLEQGGFVQKSDTNQHRKKKK